MCTVVYTLIALSTSLSKRFSAVYATSKVGGLRLLVSKRPIAEGRYQHGTPKETISRNFVPKRDFIRYCQ